MTLNLNPIDVTVTIGGKEYKPLTEVRYHFDVANDSEKDRLLPDVDSKAKLENAYQPEPIPVRYSWALYDWWVRNLKPKKNVVIINLKDEHES